MTSGLMAARFRLGRGGGGISSSSDEVGVKGKFASCESGLEGNGEDDSTGGNGKVKETSAKVSLSSEISNMVFKSGGGILNPRRRQALVVGEGILGSEDGLLVILIVAILVPFMRVRLSGGPKLK